MARRKLRTLEDAHAGLHATVQPLQPRKTTVSDLQRVSELLRGEGQEASPIKRAAGTYLQFLHASEQEAAAATVIDIALEAAKVERGDMSRMEHMLVAQAHALDGIFHRLVQRAASTEHLPSFEALMRMGLRAQNQSRAAVEALGELKYPRSVAFVHQANIAQNQQINNGDTQTQQLENRPNELGGSNELPMDARAARERRRAHPAIEAVGAVDGAEDA